MSETRGAMSQERIEVYCPNREECDWWDEFPTGQRPGSCPDCGAALTDDDVESQGSAFTQCVECGAAWRWEQERCECGSTVSIGFDDVSPPDGLGEQDE